MVMCPPQLIIRTRITIQPKGLQVRHRVYAADGIFVETNDLMITAPYRGNRICSQAGKAGRYYVIAIDIFGAGS